MEESGLIKGGEKLISEINRNDFYKCKGLVNDNRQLEVMAILNGINPGRIFVDNYENPSSGLVWLGNNDGFYFIGDEENEEFTNHLNDFIDKEIAPLAKKVGLDWFEGIGNHQRWDKVIEKVFTHRDLDSWNQRVYTLNKSDYIVKNEPNIEKNYIIQKINKTFFETKKNSLNNINFLQSKILEFWSSLDSFFNKGIGYCVVDNHTIVSVCFSGFVIDNVHCIDIETLKTHQGKKLAQKVAHRFVRDCLEKEMMPYWDCMEVNKPSIAVAESMGFKDVFNYKGYEFKF